VLKPVSSIACKNNGGAKLISLMRNLFACPDPIIPHDYNDLSLLRA
jgi:hypothetical protein